MSCRALYQRSMHTERLDGITRQVSETITTLGNLFARQWLPSVIVSDNGPQFTFEEFNQFLRKNDVKHVASASYHPQSNGQVERLVHTFQQSYKAISGLCKQKKFSRSTGLLFTSLQKRHHQIYSRIETYEPGWTSWNHQLQVWLQNQLLHALCQDHWSGTKTTNHQGKDGYLDSLFSPLVTACFGSKIIRSHTIRWEITRTNYILALFYSIDSALTKL